MQRAVCQVTMNEWETEKFMHQYHFERKDWELMGHVKQQTEKVMQVSCFYELLEQGVFCQEGKSIVAAMTLGAGVDALEDGLMQEGKMLEAYMVECFAQFYLEKAYGIFRTLFREREGIGLGKFHFLGDAYPLELTPELFRYLPQDEVTYNEAYVLIPQKSVSFMAPLTEKEHTGSEKDCANCLAREKCFGGKNS